MKNLKRAFSLCEMLVAIAVIGMIAALAVPSLAGILHQGCSLKTTRNAQTIATTYSAARAAGATFKNASTDLRGMVTELFEGKHGAGHMATSFFSVSRLKAKDLDAVLQLLRFNEVFEVIEVVPAE